MDYWMVNVVLHQPHWSSHPSWAGWVDRIIDKKNLDKDIALSILSGPASKDHPEWVEKLIDRDLPAIDHVLAEYVLSKPHWAGHPEWVERILERAVQHLSSSSEDDAEKTIRKIVGETLTQPYWAEHPELIERLLKKRNPTLDWYIGHRLLSLPIWKDHPELLELVIKNSATHPTGAHLSHFIGSSILSKPEWKDHPELLELLMDQPSVWVAMDALSHEQWKDHPEFIRSLIKKATSLEDQKRIDQDLLSKPFWRDHPELRRLTGGLKPSFESLAKGIEREEKGKGPAFSIRGCIYNMLKKRLPAE
jgi:hypothetical protein